ncbi:MAG TPA: hypothetical protein VIA62_07520 [Thermoanaerobaculia bacterium]|nr:hypothetical protein [Thermoanaerobaculia bacterium]
MRWGDACGAFPVIIYSPASSALSSSTVIWMTGTLRLANSSRNSRRLRPASSLSLLGLFLTNRRVALEDTVGVESFVEVVRGLGLQEPEVPVGDQLVLRQVAQIEIPLAQELVSDLSHGSPPLAVYSSRGTERVKP